MTTIYEVIEEENFSFIRKTDDNGVVSAIPIDPANSDYQAYLNPVEHLTEIPTPDEA